MRESSLQVNDLRISFRTTNGKVQAVRGIDFTLYKGETLAIVGESGSGKSVTSKAILGILAGNSIIEGGEIIHALVRHGNHANIRLYCAERIVLAFCTSGSDRVEQGGFAHIRETYDTEFHSLRPLA